MKIGQLFCKHKWMYNSYIPRSFPTAIWTYSLDSEDILEKEIYFICRKCGKRRDMTIYKLEEK